MSSDSRSSSSGSKYDVEVRRSEAAKPLKIVIPKPMYLADSCRSDTDSDHLPPIQSRKSNGKVVQKIVRKEERVSVGPSSSWLRPGVSLPKLAMRDVERPDAGEPLASPSISDVKPCLSYRTCSSRSTSVCSSMATRSTVGSDLATEPDVETTTVYGSRRQTDSEDAAIVGLGPTPCRQQFSLPPADITLEDFTMPEEKLEESNALKNWNVWLERTRRTQDHLKKALGKSEYDLVLNSSMDHRKALEEKSFRDICKRLEMQIEKEGKKRSRRVTTPTVECIDIPQVVRQEKNLLPKDKMLARRKHACHIREPMDKKLTRPIGMNELQVIGRGIHPSEQENAVPTAVGNVPEIEITEPESDEDGTCGPSPRRKSIFSLVINGDEIKFELGRDEDRTDERRVWDVKFGLAGVGDLTERVVTVENTGTVAVGYEWVAQDRDRKPFVNLLEPANYEPWFFFDKNPGIFVPGQTYSLKFYLRAKKSGVRGETWHLLTNPPLVSNSHLATFNLTAVATDDSEVFEIDLLDRYLTRKVAETMVRHLLDDMIYVVLRPHLYVDHIEFRSILMDKDLFEHHNQQHYYHWTVVNDLKSIFSDVRMCNYTQPSLFSHDITGNSTVMDDVDQAEWDLSYVSLLDMVLAGVGEKRKKEFFLGRISLSAKQTLRPCRLTVRKDQKHRLVYQVLCKMVNSFESDDLYYRKCLSRDVQNSTGICVVSEDNEGDPVDQTGTTMKDGTDPDLVSEVEEREMGTDDGDWTGGIEPVPCTEPENNMQLQMLMYLKVHARLSKAVEEIAGIIETRNFLKPWEKRKIRYCQETELRTCDLSNDETRSKLSN